MKTYYFQSWFLNKSYLRISAVGKQELSQLTLFSIFSTNPHYWSEKDLKGTVVNRSLPSLHGGSLEIIPLIVILYVIIRLILFNNKQKQILEGRGRAIVILPLLPPEGSRSPFAPPLSKKTSMIQINNL